MQTLKGFRDFLPENARKRQYVKEKLRTIFEKYGFEPLETPALEYADLLVGKYGEEGDKLMYRFEDHGGRDIALRYDQTVPLARVVAQYQNELTLPFKRYQMQPVWRAENTQKGRYREFLQCDADILGTTSTVADAQLLAVSIEGLKSLGFTNFRVLTNDRKIFTRMIDKNIISSDKLVPLLTSVDKLKKIGDAGVIDELISKGFDKEAAVSILSIIQEQKAPEYILEVHKILTEMGVDPKHFVFDPTLARGLDYYTDLIFEIEVEGITGSVCGGGRYDNLVKSLSGVDMPACGFAYGFDRITEALDELNLFPEEIKTSATKVLVTVFDKETLSYSLEIAYALWQKNINTQIYEETNAKLEKQLKYADRKNIPYVIVAGPEEKEKKTLKLKNLTTGEQEDLTFDSLSTSILT